MDRWWGREGRGRRGAIADRSPMLFPADARTPLINQHSGRWHAQNVAKQLGEGATGERDQMLGTGDHRPAIGCGWTITWRLSAHSCFLQRQTEAAAFALPGWCSGVSAPGSRNTCPRCPLPVRYATVLCFAATVHLVCGPRPQWSKQATDWQQARSNRWQLSRLQ